MRPRWLLALGWAFVIKGAAAIIGLTIGVQEVRALGGFTSVREVAFQFSPIWLARVASFMSRHMLGIVIIGAVEAVFMLVVGVQFLRGRGWARPGLEVLCWLGIIQAPMVMGYLVAVRGSVLRYHLPETDALAAPLARGLGTTIAWVVVYLVLLALLRGRTARTAFMRCPSTPGEA